MKKVMIRFAAGAASGILIGYLINLTINLGISEGQYIPVMSVLEARCSTQLQAVLVQTVLTALIGVVFAEAGVLYEIDRWSFLKQSIVHFLVTVVFYLPFTVLCWFPFGWESIMGILSSMLVTYSITYFVNYKICCREVATINEMVSQIRQKTTEEGN